jgi:hypothetical protein
MVRVWVINFVKQDADLAVTNVLNLLALSNEDLIIAISDDNHRDKNLTRLCHNEDRFLKIYYNPMRLKQPTLGFAWTQNYLKKALTHRPTVITKIDPDTRINGYAKLPPSFNTLSRSVLAHWTYDREGLYLPMGGYLNFTVPAARDLAHAPNDEYLKFGVHRHSQDLMLAYLCREMNIRAFVDKTLSLTNPSETLYHPMRNKRNATT